MHAFAHRQNISEINSLPREVEEAARALLVAASAKNSFQMTVLSDRDVLEAPHVDAALEELIASGDLNSAEYIDAIFDGLSAALLAEGSVEAVGDKADFASIDANIRASSSWRMLFDSTVKQPIMISDPAPMRTPGVSRRELAIEFRPSHAIVWENGRTADPSIVNSFQIACGPAAVIPVLSTYLRFQLLDRGCDNDMVPECFSLSMLQSLIETGSLVIGTEAIRVPGLGEILTAYYAEVMKRMLAHIGGEASQYEAVSISAPDWLLPYVESVRDLHPAVRIEAIAA